MPTALTPAQQGRVILDAMKEYNVRTGEVLMQQHLMMHGLKHKVANDDLMKGLEYCGQQEWIENGPEGSILLTAKGYAAV